MKGKDGITAVCVTTVTNDNRFLDVPKLDIVALRVTESARERILAAGGSIRTFDELALENPTGKNTFILRGPRTREAIKHFGPAPGIKGSHTKPYVRDRKTEIKNY